MKRRAYGRLGFTLMEIMIVVMIIGLLAAIAIPGVTRARQRAQNTRFIADLNVSVRAFEQYAIETGIYPPETAPAVIPDGMNDYLSKMNWVGPNSVGGSWDWDFEQHGFRAGVSSFVGANLADARMVEIDKMIDDGELASGSFRRHDQGYISIIEP